MKKLLIILSAALFIGIINFRCIKTYKCYCTDKSGATSYIEVRSKNQKGADRYCDTKAIGSYTNCEVK